VSELRVAIAGLGTVGTSLIRILEDESGRATSPMKIVAVSARQRDRERAVPTEHYTWWDDPVAMARADGIDVFVELMGGEDGTAKEAVEAALSMGRQVVTANKAMIAKHGLALAELAERNGAALRYEAAVAGGVPVIRALRDGLAGARVSRLKGVLNGTCNFIIGEMEGGQSYDDALSEAQKIGYAEADPSFDVGGIDAAQKLAILSALAFDTMPPLSDIAPTGIERLSTDDLRAAGDLGYRIKLVAEAVRDGDRFAFRTGPALVPISEPISMIEDSGNIVTAEAEPLGALTMTGPGAGGGATACAVAADLVTIARGATGPTFAVPVASIERAPRTDPDLLSNPFFIRVLVKDRPGVLAKLTTALADLDVSIDTIQQGPVFDPHSVTRFADAAELVITTHTLTQAAAGRLARSLEELPIVIAPASIYPILHEKD
jgi:homoserine dehydrogenase